MNRTLVSTLLTLSTLLLLAGCSEPQSASAPTIEVSDTVTAAPAPSSSDSASPPAEQAQSGAVASASDRTLPELPEDAVLEIDWDALIPADWRPETLLAEYDADNLSDDDPRAQELMAKLRALWKESPVVPELDGKRIKLPGFVVPLEMTTETIGEFLLVPYYGACIHVPPPPANQTVHVVTDEGRAYRGKIFYTVWVTGTIKVEHLSSDLAEAGYQIQDARVEAYE